MPIVLHVLIESKRAMKPIPSCNDTSVRRHKKRNVSAEVKALSEINGHVQNRDTRIFNLSDLPMVSTKITFRMLICIGTVTDRRILPRGE